MVDYDCPAICECFDRMRHARRHDGNQPRASNLCNTVDRHLKFPLDHFVNLFLRMEMLVDRRAAYEVIMCERHTGRVKIAPVPTGQALNDTKASGIYERHKKELRPGNAYYHSS